MFFGKSQKDLTSNNTGFTLVEILMVILLISILAAVAIPQFINFQDDAKDAQTKNHLSAFRAAIQMQKMQVNLKCGDAAWWPKAASELTANSIATPSTTVCPSLGNRVFLQSGVPANPWGNGTAAATVLDCAGAGCARTAACDGTTTYTNGWCYNKSTGEIWADSAAKLSF